MNNSVRWRAQIDTLEQIVRGNRFLDKLSLFVLSFAQILHHFGAKILIDPHGLQLRFADLRFRLGDRCHYLAALAVKTRGLALQGRLSRQGHQPFLEKTVHAFELTGDQLMLCRFRFHLSVETRNLFAKLTDMAVQELLGIASRRRPAIEQGNFRRPQPPEIAVIRAASHFVRHLWLIQSIAFRHQTRQPHTCLIELLGQNLGIGPQLRFVEAQKRVAGMHMHSIANQNVRYDAARWVLNFLTSDSTTSVPATHRLKAAQGMPSRHNAHTDDQHTKTNLELTLKGARSLFVSVVSGPSSARAGARPTRNA